MKNITQLVFKPKKSAIAKGVARPGTAWFDNDDPDEIDALATLAIKAAGFKRSDFFKPVRVDHLVVDDIWLQMHDRLRLLGKRVTNDMTSNLITLAGFVVWNAGQIMSGKDNAEIFAATYAAQEVGVSASTWCKYYKKHWKFMCDKCAELDYDALEKLMRKI